MSGSGGRYNSGANGPTLEDCNRLWTSIVKELMSDAEIQLRLQIQPPSQVRPKLVLRSPGLDPETGTTKWHVWATKELQANSLAFTYSQLYDLLILGYRKMEGHLMGQSGFVPLAEED